MFAFGLRRLFVLSAAIALIISLAIAFQTNKSRNEAAG